MPDYIYLLENRLSPAQRNALRQVRDAARNAGMTVFLAGGAVRDLTSGSSVRDLDFVVQGNALNLLKEFEIAGAKLLGKHDATRTLHLWFPGSVRVEVTTARREEYPKPGKAVYHWATIHEDLRRRDFTANAMALSLNESSYGLLLDPLNGVADIEARLIRIAGSYGFIEDPSRLVRAWRFHSRLSWNFEEKTLTRYQNAKEEGLIGAMPAHLIGYELEEIGHEEDALAILKALEAEGWMKQLCASWTSARADIAGLAALRQVLTQLQIQGVNPDPSAAQMELLTGKMPPKDLAGLKKVLVNPGFVEQWNRLEADSKEFAAVLTSRDAATPSESWKLLTSYQAEPVLWLAFTSKSAAVQAKFKNFFTVWPEARQKIPTALLLEMRITPELPGYNELLQQIFFELMDGKLQTEEELRAFLAPHSPPAPPPPINLRRSRGRKADLRAKIVEDDAEEPDVLNDEEEEDEENDLDAVPIETVSVNSNPAGSVEPAPALVVTDAGKLPSPVTRNGGSQANALAAAEPQGKMPQEKKPGSQKASKSSHAQGSGLPEKVAPLASKPSTPPKMEEAKTAARKPVEKTSLPPQRPAGKTISAKTPSKSAEKAPPPKTAAKASGKSHAKPAGKPSRQAAKPSASVKRKADGLVKAKAAGEKVKPGKVKPATGKVKPTRTSPAGNTKTAGRAAAKKVEQKKR